MAQAYRLLTKVIDDTDKLDLQILRVIHTELIANTSWADGEYLGPGETRTSTWNTVVIDGSLPSVHTGRLTKSWVLSLIMQK